MFTRQWQQVNARRPILIENARHCFHIFAYARCGPQTQCPCISHYMITQCAQKIKFQNRLSAAGAAKRLLLLLNVKKKIKRTIRLTRSRHTHTHITIWASALDFNLAYLRFHYRILEILVTPRSTNFAFHLNFIAKMKTSLKFIIIIWSRTVPPPPPLPLLLFLLLFPSHRYTHARDSDIDIFFVFLLTLVFRSSLLTWRSHEIEIEGTTQRKYTECHSMNIAARKNCSNKFSILRISWFQSVQRTQAAIARCAW